MLDFCTVSHIYLRGVAYYNFGFFRSCSILQFLSSFVSPNVPGWTLILNIPAAGLMGLFLRTICHPQLLDHSSRIQSLDFTTRACDIVCILAPWRRYNSTFTGTDSVLFSDEIVNIRVASKPTNINGASLLTNTSYDRAHQTLIWRKRRILLTYNNLQDVLFGQSAVQDWTFS